MKPDHLKPEEALDLIHRTRRLSDAALLYWHNGTSRYFADDLAREFDRVFEMMQKINDARRHRRALAEKAPAVEYVPHD
jgi:hypothetical protein